MLDWRIDRGMVDGAGGVVNLRWDGALAHVPDAHSTEMKK